MTPQRLAEIRAELNQANVDLKVTLDALAERNQAIVDLTTDLETERARLDCIAKLCPGELFDALSDSRGLRAVLDERIAEREKGVVG